MVVAGSSLSNSPLSTPCDFSRAVFLRLKPVHGASAAEAFRRRLPIWAGPVMLMGTRLPISVVPAIVAELRHILQLLLRDVSSEPAEGRIVAQSIPRNRIVAVA